jgi:flagellar hook protein FlgE
MTFRTAISGIRAASAELNVIGNNIANVNTNGFKGSRTEFSDVFATANNGVVGKGTGHGVNTARVAQQFSQGNITFTDNNLDLAINGLGFFIVDDNGAQLYSRDGAFGVDREGYIVNSNAQRLMAFGTDATGNVTGALNQLRVSTANSAPQATASVQLGANLDSQQTVPLVAPFNPNNNSSYNSTSAATVYDSLGGSHTMQFYFVKTGAGAWNVHTAVDGTAVGAGQPITFNTSGALATPASGELTLPAFTPSGGGAAMNVTINISETTQFGAPFGINRVVQDGYATGRLVGIDIDTQGMVFARYSNGQSNVQGQVALANFANPQGLRSLGNNNWSETFDAGAVVVAAPGSSNMGQIQSGALEDANVDLSEQLVNLIVAQRNFQANTEVIQTADATTQALINIR